MDKLTLPQSVQKIIGDTIAVKQSATYCAWMKRQIELYNRLANLAGPMTGN